MSAEDTHQLDYVQDAVELDDGRTAVAHIAPLGPPEVTGFKADAPVVDVHEAQALLSDVPLFDWSNGCSATAGAMLFGYYDRTGFPDMYAGPANGGLCPLNNATAWAPGVTPLSATRQGYDALDVYGHVDDYWSAIGSDADPYLGNWEEHGHADCTADFMGTSQWANWSNVDGSTTFFFASDKSPLYDYSGSESDVSPRRDGCHGLRLFAESRGYSVIENYNQYIAHYDGNASGFTLAEFQDEIDAARPVLVQVAGHTMLGVGYGAGDTIYVHDTWDHQAHEMTWAGEYQGMQHYGVTVIQLEPPGAVPTVSTGAVSSVEETSASLNGSLVDGDGETCEYRFEFDIDGGEPYSLSTPWTGAITGGQGFSEAVSTLQPGTTYFYRAQARNSAGTASGEEVSFTTKPKAPSGLSAAAASSESIDLSWTSGEGSTETLVIRKPGNYPAGPTDGEQVYIGSAGSCTDSGLVPGTTYYYRAWAHALPGDQWSDGYADASARTQDTRVLMPSCGVPVGGTSTLPVSINGAVDLAAASITLSFDPAVVQLTDFSSGDLGAVTTNGLSEANSTGQLTMSWSSATGYSGDFAFAGITMEGSGSSGASSVLDLTVDVFNDSRDAPISHQVTDGLVTLLSLMEGDVSGDFTTNIVDAMYVAQYTVGARQLDSAALICADTNDDGVVNIVDAMHIAQYTVDPDCSGGVLFKELWESPPDDGLLRPA